MKAFKRLLGLILVLVSPLVLAEKALVAVASNFSQSMQVLKQAFEAKSEHQVVLSYGSSGKFYAQIKQGAPYDLFFSADQAKGIALEQDKLIVAGSRFTYAIGKLVLWSAKGEFAQQLLTKFKQNAFNKLAMANPKLAPYGQAAIHVLTHMQMLDLTQAKWIQAENVAQVYQFVHSKNADLGFVALSQLVNKPAAVGHYWLIPEAYYPAIKQDAVWLNRAQTNLAAKAFLDFVASPLGQSIISQQGYSTIHKEPL
ncbi:molybdate ABC transporter substrate-binding protein [Paraglaciecola aestuariivivens]